MENVLRLWIASGPIGHYMATVPKHVEEAHKLGFEMNLWNLQMVADPVKEVILSLTLATFNHVLWIASGLIGHYMATVPKHVEEELKLGPEQNLWKLHMVADSVKEVILGLTLATLNHALWIASGLIGH